MAVDQQGQLKDNLLITNPRCGSGSGINLDRVLRKLSIERDQVDRLLENYLGDVGEQARLAIPVRADRCGVLPLPPQYQIRIKVSLLILHLQQRLNLKFLKLVNI